MYLDKVPAQAYQPWSSNTAHLPYVSSIPRALSSLVARVVWSIGPLPSEGEILFDLLGRTHWDADEARYDNVQPGVREGLRTGLWGGKCRGVAQFVGSIVGTPRVVRPES